MNKARHNRRGRQRAFTLVEVLVTIIVIGTLLGLLITGLNHAGKLARKAAQRQTVASLKTATTQFESEFGFLPPLVYDGSEMGSATGRGTFSNAGPVYTTGNRTLVNVYRMGDANARAFLQRNGGWANVAQPYVDSRYSKFTLPFYVMGALGQQVDGVEGLGMVAPKTDGSWAGVGDAMTNASKSYEPFMDGGKSSARINPNYNDAIESRELGGTDPGNLSSRFALVDSGGKAFRFYRWLHEDTVQTPADLNIPAALVDPVTLQNSLPNNTQIDVTDGNAELRAAKWAIVGAGADGLFGTERIEDLRDKLKLPSDMPEVQVRQRAMEDNLVEYGR